MKEKLTINPAIWLHREGAHVSYLLRASDGKRCCLGIYLQDNCGISPDLLQGQGSPRQLPKSIRETLPDWLSCLSDNNTPLVERLMAANDIPTTGERVARLDISSLFAEVGVEVEFTEE